MNTGSEYTNKVLSKIKVDGQKDSTVLCLRSNYISIKIFFEEDKFQKDSNTVTVLDRQSLKQTGLNATCQRRLKSSQADFHVLYFEVINRFNYRV